MTQVIPEELVADFGGGFIQIPNLLYEALMVARLNATQKDICSYIIRLTYGWKQEEAPISINEFAIAFNVDRKWILRQLMDLIRKRIIIKTCCLEDNKSVWKININIFEWDNSILNLDQLRSMKKTNASENFRQQSLWNASSDPDVDMDAYNQTSAAVENNSPEVVVNSPPGVVVNSPPGVGVNTPLGVGVNTPLGVGVNTPPPQPALSLEDSQLQTPLNKVLNTNINTNRNKKKKSTIYSENSVSYSLAKFLLDKIRMNYPESKEPDLQQWALYVDRMIKYDKRDPETVKKVIIFAEEDDFWLQNILCAKTLRKHFERLDVQRLKREKDRARYKKEVADKDEYDFFFQRKN